MISDVFIYKLFMMISGMSYFQLAHIVKKKKKVSHHQCAISSRRPSPETARGIPLTHMQSPEELLSDATPQFDLHLRQIPVSRLALD